MTGKKGQVLAVETLAGTIKQNVFGQTQDTDTTMTMILAVDKTTKKRTFTLYDNVEDANAKRNGIKYVVDCSKAVFGA